MIKLFEMLYNDDLTWSDLNPFIGPLVTDNIAEVKVAIKGVMIAQSELILGDLKDELTEIGIV